MAPPGQFLPLAKGGFRVSRRVDFGAAPVVLCFGLIGAHGAVWALWLGAGTTALAAAFSSARLWAPQPLRP